MEPRLSAKSDQMNDEDVHLTSIFETILKLRRTFKNIATREVNGPGGFYSWTIPFRPVEQGRRQIMEPRLSAKSDQMNDEDVHLTSIFETILKLRRTFKNIATREVNGPGGFYSWTIPFRPVEQGRRQIMEPRLSTKSDQVNDEDVHLTSIFETILKLHRTFKNIATREVNGPGGFYSWTIPFRPVEQGRRQIMEPRLSTKSDQVNDEDVHLTSIFETILKLHRTFKNIATREVITICTNTATVKSHCLYEL